MTELLSDPKHIRGDLQIINAALVKKWDLPDALLTKLPMVMAQIAIKGKPKEQIAATKNLMLMKEANDRQCNVNTVDTQRNRILELIEQRGTGGSDIATEPRGSGIVT
jgi:HD-like signal output (HDOD) protein